MDLRKLKTLVDLVSESNIAELEITEADGKVRIVKSVPQVPMPAAAQLSAYGPVPAGAMPAPTMPTNGEPATAAADPVPPGHVVKSPMVGTFYRAGSPGAKPFVDIGSEVKEGDAICIIEAMKIMNEIDADKAGKITSILCQNGQAVEFGQPLFVIE
jgi:acetyl-CoA carboxylase biotin carboxyl carrier protein